MSTPPRFYCPIPLAERTRVALPDAAAHHASRALRLREGDAIVLFNGDGSQYEAALRFDQGKAMADVGDRQHTGTELPGAIVLLQGLPSGDKMDWIIEKAAELGVSAVYPVQAERSIVQLSGARLEKRQQHWQRIAESASEQSGRNKVLQVHPLQTLDACLRSLPHGAAESTPGYLCHPEGGRPLLDAVADPARDHKCGYRLLVGPEGGWTDRELERARNGGFEQVRFGSRVLRTETAGLAMTAATCAVLGWI